MDWEDERAKFANAASQAKQLGAALVAHSGDRFLRSTDYHNKLRTGILPAREEYDRFFHFVGDVPVATLWSPELHWKAIDQLSSQAAIETRGSKIGRRVKQKTRRQIWEPEIPRLRAEGLKWHQIAVLVGVTEQTLHRWMRKPKTTRTF